MGQTTQSRDIDGMTFQISQLTPKLAAKVANRLRRAAAPAIGAMLESSKAGQKITDLDVEKLANALGAIDLSDEDMDYFPDTLLQGAFVTVDGKTSQLMPQFNLIFQGKLNTMFKVLAFAVEVNFGDFFVALRALGAGQAKAQSPSPGSTT